VIGKAQCRVRLTVCGFGRDPGEQTLRRASYTDQLVVIDRFAIDDIGGQLLGPQRQGRRLPDQTALGFGQSSTDLGFEGATKITIPPR
jgi:hypothetical protein